MTVMTVKQLKQLHRLRRGPAVHFKGYTVGGHPDWTCCGLSLKGDAIAKLLFTDAPESVTCKRCRKILIQKGRL